MASMVVTGVTTVEVLAAIACIVVIVGLVPFKGDVGTLPWLLRRADEWLDRRLR